MATVRANLDVSEYVRVTSDPAVPATVLLQSHRDTVRIVFSDTKPSKSNKVYHELGGEHEPLNIPLTELGVWALAMTERSALTVTEQRVPVEISNRDNIGQSVYIQDQTTQAIDVFFTSDKGQVTTTNVAPQGGHDVDLEPGHGAVVGDVIESRTAENYVQAEIIAVVGDTITVATPWSRTFPIGVTVGLGSPMLNVIGSLGAPIVFNVDPSALQNIDITRLIISITDSDAMDFTTFGSLSKLDNGCTLRYLNENLNFTNLFNWRNNNELIERAFDHAFESKTGGGEHGFVAKSTWSGSQHRGVTLRVDGARGEELQVVVQDDLSALSQFRVVVQGHIVQ